jgi:glycine dehydrogenase subunit 2
VVEPDHDSSGALRAVNPRSPSGSSDGGEPLIFERGGQGHGGWSLPPRDVPVVDPERVLGSGSLRVSPLPLPRVSEPEVVRHFVNLSVLNHHVDRAIYPLGSCTMKYNPKVNDVAAAFEGFRSIHPDEPEDMVQGALEVMYELEHALCAIGGLARATLQPAAGAQGELTALLMIRAYHASRGDPRRVVLIPDSAHGTNPASVSLAGYRAQELKSDADGLLSPDAVRRAMGPHVAALMMTNPNTLGLFEVHCREIAAIVREGGGLLYMDGANLNALLGVSRPGDLGVDAVHFNLHKTFSTPHGGGGPGAGPVGVGARLEPFLPVPIVERDADGRYYFDYDRPESIGKVLAYYGHFGVMVRALTYILTLGEDGLKQVTRRAVVNANYLLRKLEPHFQVPYPGPCMHEFVLSGRRQKDVGVRTLDMAKRLLDYGVHAPTVYFPLIVPEALMIEPTETESKASLDAFADALIRIAAEARSDPDVVRTAPHTTPVGRLDETAAARNPCLRWGGQGCDGTPSTAP